MPSSETDLSRRFSLRTHRFEHGGFRVELIAPSSPDDLIDVSDFNSDERLPYWAELWPSARALTSALLDLPPPRGRVLELGCGIALPSLALRWRGASIVASDYYPEALEFARANALRNDIPPLQTLLLDWRTPPRDLEPFELVIAADVLYERRNAEALAQLLPGITAPGGKVLFADPGRAHARDFEQLLGSRAWEIEEIASRTVTSPVAAHGPTVRLLSIRRSAAAHHRPGPKL